MQKVNVDVHIWNELRSNDQFGLNTPTIFPQFYPLAFRYHSVTILYFPNSLLEGCLPQIDVINKI